MPVLAAVVKDRDHAVEFGCGKFSTPFLLGKCASVLSVEQASPAWLEAIKNLTGNPAHWTAVMAPQSDFMAVEYPEKIDVAFVDGLPATRWGCVCLMMALRVPVIIAHDTEEELPYRWSKIRHPKYHAETYKELTPWTTVWRRS